MKNRRFGLIGYPLGHSFSRKYFSDKFQNEGITDAVYELYPIGEIGLLPDLIKANDLAGFNVTIPYKEQVVPFLSSLDENAARIGAVNVVKKMPDGGLRGFNSDFYGFLNSLLVLKSKNEWKGCRALVFGTGGSSKAVEVVLSDLGISLRKVSRTAKPGILAYSDVTMKMVEGIDLLVNCTPLGMYPEVGSCVPIPFEGIGPKHCVVDLVYNPEETLFLKNAREQGARTMNGLPMLIGQAEKAWEIWNS